MSAGLILNVLEYGCGKHQIEGVVRPRHSRHSAMGMGLPKPKAVHVNPMAHYVVTDIEAENIRIARFQGLVDVSPSHSRSVEWPSSCSAKPRPPSRISSLRWTTACALGSSSDAYSSCTMHTSPLRADAHKPCAELRPKNVGMQHQARGTRDNAGRMSYACRIQSGHLGNMPWPRNSLSCPTAPVTARPSCSRPMCGSFRGARPDAVERSDRRLRRRRRHLPLQAVGTPDRGLRLWPEAQRAQNVRLPLAPLPQ